MKLKAVLRDKSLHLAAIFLLAAQVVPNIARAQTQPRRLPVFWEESSLFPAVRSTWQRLRAWSTSRSRNRLQPTSRYRPI